MKIIVYILILIILLVIYDIFDDWQYERELKKNKEPKEIKIEK